MGRTNNYASGRGGRGRGGRSSGRSVGGRYTSGNNTHKLKTSEMKFTKGNVKSASKFTSIKKYILNEIVKKYTDGDKIEKYILTGVAPDWDATKPTVKVSSATDDATKLSEQNVFNLEYAQERKEWNEEKREYENHCRQVYAYIMDKCESAMQAQIEASENFLTEIKFDPYKLMKAIGEFSLDAQDNKHRPSVIMEAMAAPREVNGH